MANKLKEIHIPSNEELPEDQRPRSALDGISLTAIDTDPESNVVMSVNGLLNGPYKQQIVAVLPWQFHGNGRTGFVIVSYDPSADPSYEKPTP